MTGSAAPSPLAPSTLASSGALGNPAATDGPVVVTSLNPFAKLGLQRRCLDRWADLGLDTFTANVDAEAERLVAAGLSPERILTVQTDDSGAVLHGKPVPLIRPLLARCATRFPGRSLILTNSDIYPAARDAGVIGLFMAQAPIAALVREDTASIESASFAARAPYRGGLDVFAMTAERLAALNDALTGIEAAGLMAFGIPGWDYLMGALTLSLGGAIMDSGLLLHERHGPTYANVDAFFPYVPAMAALKMAEGPSAAEAAHQFYQRIEHECRMSAAATRLARLKYYRQPLAQTTPQARRVVAQFLALAPFAAPVVNFAALTALADDLRGEPPGARADMERVLNLFDGGAGLHAAFREALLATLFARLARAGLDPPPRAPRATDGRHIRAVRRLSEAGEQDFATERRAVARLYAAERGGHGLHNADLFAHLIASADNAAERTLLTLLDPAADITRHAA